MKRLLLRSLSIGLLLIFSHCCQAQDSSHLRISLLTCTPGEELYSTFGHSAIRIVDSSSLQDIVFNYGTFNFEEPGFYTKFIRGKLRYYVAADYFENFKAEYQASNRGITEQVLNLPADKKIALLAFLFNNLKEENKYYQYDFLFDNCTTRLRDAISRFETGHPLSKAVMPAGTTFRNAIHQYLDRNQKDWSKLGIDLLLGAPTDAVMTVTQSQFLPDNLMKALDSASQYREFVVAENAVYPYSPPVVQGPFITPVTAVLLLTGLFLLVDVFGKRSWAKAMLHGFDGLLFFLTGAIGVLLVFMWLGTDHAMCKNNYNLLWAWPIHLPFSFYLNSSRSWVKKYLAVTAIGLSVLAASWFFLPQQLNPAFLLFNLLLVYRCLRRATTPSV